MSNKGWDWCAAAETQLRLSDNVVWIVPPSLHAFQQVFLHNDAALLLSGALDNVAQRAAGSCSVDTPSNAADRDRVVRFVLSIDGTPPQTRTGPRGPVRCCRAQPAGDYALRRRREAATPSRPRPSSAADIGSGTCPGTSATMLTLSTPAWKKNWLSTSPKRSL